MTASFHPTEDYLLGYALGTLDTPTALVVAGHLEGCAECRAEVARMEAVGGALLDMLPEEPANTVTETDIAHLLDRLDAIQQPEDKKAPEAQEAPPVSSEQTVALIGDAELPSCLRPYLEAAGANQWKWLGRGVRYLPLVTDQRGERAGLIHVRDRRATLRHGHSGEEITLVLKGAYRSGDRLYAAGDVECTEPGVVHCPTAEGGDCLCLVTTRDPIIPANPVIRGLYRALTALAK